ncbi:MAG: chlorophyllide reductase iron protein subunit X, partial [Pseudomonadota bacterium]
MSAPFDEIDVVAQRDAALRDEASMEPDAPVTEPPTKETQIIAIYG